MIKPKRKATQVPEPPNLTVPPGELPRARGRRWIAMGFKPYATPASARHGTRLVRWRVCTSPTVAKYWAEVYRDSGLVGEVDTVQVDKSYRRVPGARAESFDRVWASVFGTEPPTVAAAAAAQRQGMIRLGHSPTELELSKVLTISDSEREKWLALRARGERLRAQLAER